MLRPCLVLLAVLLLPCQATAAPSFSPWDARPDSEPEAIAAGPGSPYVWVGEYETYSAVAFVTPGAVPQNGLTEMTSADSVEPFGNGGSGFVTGVTPGPDGNGWFSQGYLNRIGRIATGGTFATFVMPTAGAHPTDMVVGGDGAIWAQEDNADKLARIPTTITNANQITEFTAPSVTGLTSGPDGALYFSEGTKIARMNTSGTITNEYPLGVGMTADQVTWGPDESGATNWIWFTDTAPNPDKLGRLDPVSGTTQEFTLPVGVNGLQDITAAPDGRVYATAPGSDHVMRAKPVFGSVDAEAFPRTSGVDPYGITVGPDGNVWFTERLYIAGTHPHIVRMGIVAAAASTAAATAVGNTSATLNASVNPNGSPTHVAFSYGTDPGLAGATTSPGTNLPADESNHPTSEAIGGLTTGVTYYYKVIADNGNGAVGGTIRSFTPGSAQPNAPHNTALPQINGGGQVGNTPTCTTGTWTNDPTVFTYQWERDGAPIGGATADSYTLVDADADHQIVCAVTAANGGGSETATSPSVTPVALPAQITAAPRLSAIPQVGVEVSCSPGTWTHQPSFSYHWELDGATIPGAQSSTYTPGDGQAGQGLSCRVTATNSGGSVDVSTDRLGIRGRPPVNTSPPKLVGTPQVGKGFTCDPGTWSTTPTEYRFEWLRDGVLILTEGQPNYSPPRDDIGHEIACQVTAFNGPFVPSAPAASAGLKILPPPPSVLIAPKITGDILVGGKVTCDTGTWLDSNGLFSYRWYRNDQQISGFTSRRDLTRDDAGQVVECRVTAFGPGGTSEARARASVPLIVRNMRVTGIEVTQGIQKDNCSGCLQTLPSRPPGNLFGSQGQAQYQGVRMAAFHWTVVRVFADYTNPSKVGGGALEGVGAQLQIGGDSKHKLIVLSPDSSPASIPEAAAGAEPSVSIDQRDDPNASFNFLIPWQDTDRKYLSFRATIGPANADPKAPRQCDGCQANQFDLLNVGPFRQTADVRIHPYPIAISGVRTSQTESQVFGSADAVLPVNFRVSAYATPIEINTILNNPKVTNKSDAVAAAVAKRASDDKLGNDQYPVGVFVSGAGGLGALTLGGRVLYGGGGPPVSIVRDSTRPLTSVTHEIGHGLGLVHADTMPHPSGAADCGGDSKKTQPPKGDQVGEAWPPDNEGRIQGVGFDRRAWDIYKTGSRPRAFSEAHPAAKDIYYDFMSYCGGSDEPHHWMSVRNWERLIDFHAPTQTLRRAVPTATAAAENPVRVIATVDPDGHVSIFDVAPGQTTTGPPSSGSQYHVNLLDAAGNPVATAVPSVSVIHIDGQAPGLLLETTLPLSAGAVAVSVDAGGPALARRDRSAHAPTAKVVAPRAGAHPRGKTVLVSWTATDADKDPLTTAVDYSADGGRSWKVVADAVTGTSAKVPARFLSASRNARVRVRASDGFDVATAISGRFTAAGTPPIARIVEGVRGGRMRADALLLLSGAAFDDAGTPLTGRRLHWFAGKRRLGTGEQVSVQGLPPGRTRIRLVAIDRHGRKGEASFPLRVASVRPIFLTFSGPSRLGRNARRITLTVASTVPAVLKIGGRRFSVNRTKRKISVAIKPGAAALRLGYTLSASGRTTRGVFTAPRR